MKRLWDGLVRGTVHLFTDYTWTFWLIMFITVASTAVSIQYLTVLEARLQDVYENDVRGGDSVQTAATALLAVENAIKDHLLATEPAAQSKALAELKTQRDLVTASLKRAVPRFYTPRAKQALLVAQQDWIVTLETLDALDWQKTLELSERLESDLTVLIANRAANSAKGVTDLVVQLRWSLLFTIAVLVITVVVRIGLYWAGHPNRRKTDGPESSSN